MTETLTVAFPSDPQLDRFGMVQIHNWTQRMRDHDAESAGHLARLAALAATLADCVGLDDHSRTAIRIAAPMHDIGKLEIEPEVLFHPGPFSEQQFSSMKAHATLGHRLLSAGEGPLLRLAASIALTHHERWDGTGYPHGLGGTDIPLEGRLVAVADVFDALASARRYKPALRATEAAGLLLDGSGAQFDPVLVEAFLDNLDIMIPIVQGGAPATLAMAT